MSEEVYSITDINGYVSQMRQVAAETICENITEDLNDYISIGQMINLVNDNCIGFDTNNRPMLNETINEKLFEEISIWIHSVGLSKLAAKDFIECAWDNELNEMIFWAKEPIKNVKPKPKRKRKNT